MLLDNTLVFSEEQAITAEAASTNVVDQLAAGDAYQSLFVVADVKEAFASATALDVAIETSEDATFEEDVKELAKVHLPVAELTLDACIVKMRLPVGCKRYIRLNYIPTGTPSAGKVTAFLTAMPPIAD